MNWLLVGSEEMIKHLKLDADNDLCIADNCLISSSFYGYAECALFPPLDL